MLNGDDVQYIVNSHKGFLGANPNPGFTVVLLSGDEISTSLSDCRLEDHYMTVGNTYIPYSAIAMILF